MTQRVMKDSLEVDQVSTSDSIVAPSLSSFITVPSSHGSAELIVVNA